MRVTLRQFGFWWGIGGVLGVVGFAVYRLSQQSLAMFTVEVAWFHWLFMLVWCSYMLWKVGRAFRVSFGPRAVARAHYIRRHGTILQILLAPLFCFGYFSLRRRYLLATYGLTIGIGLFIVAIRYLAQPWAGMIDAGAVAGLSYGFVVLIRSLVAQRQLNGEPYVS